METCTWKASARKREGRSRIEGVGKKEGMHDDRAFSRGLSFFLYAAVVLLVVCRMRARGGVFLLLELKPGRSAWWAGIGVVIDEVHAGDADITGPKCGEARSHELGLPVWRNSRACKSLRREREKPRTGLCGTGGSLDGFVRARLRNWIRLRERYVLGCIVDLPCAGRYPTT
jgi:hypothetical protein